MVTRATFSISYYCRESKKTKQGLAPLEMCININQERMFLNLPVKLNPKDFNKKRKPIEIEKLLSTFRTKTNEVINEIIQQGLPLTASVLKEYFKYGGTKSVTIEMLVESYLKQLSNRIGVSLKESVYKKYQLVGDFLIQELNNRELCTITNNDIIVLYDKLKQKYLQSTAAGYFIKIRSMFNFAVDNNMIKTNPANSIKVNKGTVRVEFLTKEELTKITNLNLDYIDRLDRVRDLALFQSSTGLSYADLVLFDSNKIEVINNTPTYTNNRQKTGIEFSTVILPIGMEILKKYNGCLPLISNEKYNSYLKEIQKLANIKTNLTTHLLRKTFCHNMLNGGIRVEVVAKCMGHAKVGTTLKHYGQIKNYTVANEIGSLIANISNSPCTTQTQNITN